MDSNSSFSAETKVTASTWNRIYLVLFVSYVIIGLIIRIIVPTFGDINVFVHATSQLLSGSLDIYSYLTVTVSAPPLGTGYTYSPLLAIILAPFVAVVDLLGLGDDWATKLTVIPLLLIDILAMQQFRRLVRTWRPSVDERVLFFGVFISLMLTGFLFVSAERGHHESLILLGILLTLRFAPKNIYLAGLFSALALAAKQTALLELIPIGLVILTVGFSSRNQASNPQSNRPRAAPLARITAFAAWAGIAGGLFLALIFPFWLANPGAVQYAFITAMSRLTLYGPGLPGWIDKALQALFSQSTYSSLHEQLLAYSNPLLVTIVFVGSVVAVFWAGQRGRPVGLTDPRLLALIAFAGVAQIAFGKWVGGHYYQVPLMLVFFWDIVRSTPPTLPSANLAPVRTIAPFPITGLIASVAFRAITSSLNDEHLTDLKSVLLFLLFFGLAGITLHGATAGRCAQ